MNLGTALGVGLGAALATCALRDEEEEKLDGSGIGCKCRAKMDSTFEDDSMSGASVGCAFHSSSSDDEEIELRGRTRSGFPGMQPFKPGPFAGFSARAGQVRPRMSGRLAHRHTLGQTTPGNWNCQQTSNGQKICRGGPNCGVNKRCASNTLLTGSPAAADGTPCDYFQAPADCHTCPPNNVPGIAADQDIGGILTPVNPSCPGGGSIAGIPIVPLAIGGGILALLLLS